MRCLKLFLFLASLATIVNSRFLSAEDSEAALSFKLIHVNDIHAHFDQVDQYTSRCRKVKCFNH
jgi:2',3'-cyclic-nucleotide 2'-phosphodiesterase (5'-nucleotidase family)